MKTFLCTCAAALLVTSLAYAQDKKFAGYIIKSKTPTVEGTMLVNGYSYAEVLAFLKQDCAGASGNMKLVGKPYRRKGYTFQKFRAACNGGPTPRVGATSSLAVENERMPDGRTMTEYTFSNRGNVGYSRMIR